ncbi:MAG: hypothetical protein R2867_23335 [Caldilineaceae bacterium]
MTPAKPRKAAIDNLRSVGIATIAAAGNEGHTNGISAPACISSVVSVGATYDANDKIVDFPISLPIWICWRQVSLSTPRYRAILPARKVVHQWPRRVSLGLGHWHVKLCHRPQLTIF